MHHPHPGDVFEGVRELRVLVGVLQMKHKGVDRAGRRDEVRRHVGDGSKTSTVDAERRARVNPRGHLGGELGHRTDRLDPRPRRELGIGAETTAGKIVSARRVLVARVSLRREQRSAPRVRVQREHGVRQLQPREIKEVVQLAERETVRDAVA